MAVRTVYDDGALRVLGGLSAPEVGAGRAFGAGVQQRQEQRKGELGMDATRLNMDATRLNMEQTRQAMRLREEAAKRAAAANARAQARAAAYRQLGLKFGGPSATSSAIPFTQPGGGTVGASPIPFSMGGGSQGPLSLGSAGAPSTGGAGGGAGEPQAGLQLPSSSSPQLAMATSPLSFGAAVGAPSTPAGLQWGPQLAMMAPQPGGTQMAMTPAAPQRPVGVQTAMLDGREAFRMAMEANPELFGVQTADASGAASVNLGSVRTADGRTVSLSVLDPTDRRAYEQGLAAGPDPVLTDDGYFVYSDGRVFDIDAARSGRDPFDVPTNVQDSLRARAGVTAAPEAAPVSPTERSFMTPDAMQQRASMAQAPGPQALPAAGGEFVPVNAGGIQYQVNPVTGEVVSSEGPVTDIEGRNRLVSMAVGQLNAEKRQLEDQFQRIQTALTEREPSRTQQETYNRVQQELQRVNQLLSPEPLRNAAQATTLFTPRGVGAEEGPGVAGPAPVTLTTTPEGTSVVAAPAPAPPPAQTAGVKVPGTDAAPAQTPPSKSTAGAADTPPDVSKPVTVQSDSDVEEGDIVDDPVAQVEADAGSRFERPAKFRYSLLGDPPALNQQLVRASARRDQLYEAYQAYAQAGFMAEAQQFAQQIQALDASLGMMAANQAVNDAVIYNDTRRLGQVLSNATDLGPVKVIAQRNADNEVVFTITTPGDQPISPKYTQMSRDQLEKAVRMFVDAEYRAQVAEINLEREKEYAKAEGKALGEAAGERAKALSDAELREAGVIPGEVFKQDLIPSAFGSDMNAILLTYKDGRVVQLEPTLENGVLTYRQVVVNQ